MRYKRNTVFNLRIGVFRFESLLFQCIAPLNYIQPDLSHKFKERFDVFIRQILQTEILNFDDQ